MKNLGWPKMEPPMPFGLSPQVFYHVVISLIGIVTGFVVMWGMISGRRLLGWTAFFLSFTVLTSATGFALPAKSFTPPHAFGVLSSVVLSVAIYAYYSKRLTGGWRLTYVLNAIIAQYLNVFVLVVQSFQKLPPLKALAPTQTEAPFAIAHLVVLAAFVIFTVFAIRRFRPTVSATS